MESSTAQTLIEEVADRVRLAGVFGEIEAQESRLRCAARGVEAEAWYELALDEEGWTVALLTPDRWLSESIEADLMHTGDPIEELVEEELVARGYDGKPPAVRHFRSDDRLYTFRSPIPIDDPTRSEAVDVAAQWLIAYEATFSQLGDMRGGETE